MLQFISEDAEVEEWEVENYDENENPVTEPFRLNSKIIVDAVIEKAGDSYLFKVGTVIGPQVEMYQERERQCKVMTTFPHGYLREITFNIPDGYKVSGLEKLKIDIQYGNDDMMTMGFISNYEMVDESTVKVTINEFYTEVIYPLSEFEKYREVINAAADFNKIVVVFEKE